MIKLHRQLTTRHQLASRFPVILDAALDEKLYELLCNPALSLSGSLSLTPSVSPWVCPVNNGPQERKLFEDSKWNLNAGCMQIAHLLATSRPASNRFEEAFEDLKWNLNAGCVRIIHIWATF